MIYNGKPLIEFVFIVCECNFLIFFDTEYKK